MRPLQAADGALLAGETVPLVVAGVLGATALVALAILLRQPATRRPYLAVGVVVSLALAVANAAAATGVVEDAGVDAAVAASVARVAAYAAALPLVLAVAGRIGALQQPLTGTLAAVGLGHVVGIAGWLVLDGDPGLVALGVAVVLAAVGAYVAVGAIGGGASPARRLLLVRLLGLVGVVWSLALVALALSAHGTAVLDGYATTLVAGYLDVAFGAGVSGLLVTAGTALDDATGTSDAAATGTNDPAGSADADQFVHQPGVAGGTGDRADGNSGGAAAGDGGTVSDGEQPHDE